MKRVALYLIILVSCAVSCVQKPEIGKSMGRWKDFGFEAMKMEREAGIGYIEVTMNNIINDRSAGVREISEKIMEDVSASGLKVWSVHMPFSGTLDISVLNDSLRAANVQFMKDIIRIAGVFKPQRIVLHPSSEPISPEEREQRLINSHESIGKLAPVAKEIGAILCIENLPRTCLGQNGEEMMLLIDGYDDVGLCFDTNHLIYQSHADYLKAVAKGKIKTVHLSDYDFKDERHWIPGNGQIAWPELWQGILDNGYDGIMMFETYASPDELKKARILLQSYK